VGTHKAQVRAVRLSGMTATTPAATVVAEATAPTFTTNPYLALRAVMLNTTAVPPTLWWEVTDIAALKRVRLMPRWPRPAVGGHGGWAPM